MSDPNTNTPRPAFSSTISLGNVLSIAAVLLPGIGAWTSLNMQLATLRQSMEAETTARVAVIAQVSSDLQEAYADRVLIENRLDAQGEMIARSDERFSIILSTVTELKNEVRKLAEKH